MILNSRAVSKAGEAACMLVWELILRGSDTAASGVAYWTSNTVTWRSASTTSRSSGSVIFPSCTNQTLCVLTARPSQQPLSAG
jgi:hypothetical protein